jgi:hypothetical protein
LQNDKSDVGRGMRKNKTNGKIRSDIKRYIWCEYVCVCVCVEKDVADGQRASADVLGARVAAVPSLSLQCKAKGWKKGGAVRVTAKCTARLESFWHYMICVVSDGVRDSEAVEHTRERGVGGGTNPCVCVFVSHRRRAHTHTHTTRHVPPKGPKWRTRKERGKEQREKRSTV